MRLSFKIRSQSKDEARKKYNRTNVKLYQFNGKNDTLLTESRIIFYAIQIETEKKKKHKHTLKLQTTDVDAQLQRGRT